MKRYRIIKDYWGDSLAPYYVVQEKGWFFWKSPISLFLSDRARIPTCILYVQKKFNSIEEAEFAIQKAKESDALKAEVVKVL